MARGVIQQDGSMTTTDLTICPFEVHVSDEDLANLRRRIAATRWPGKELVAAWGRRARSAQSSTWRVMAASAVRSCGGAWAWSAAVSGTSSRL